MSETITIGILGAGRIGSFHAELLVKRIEGVNVAAVADIHLPSARACAAKLDIPLVTSRAEDIFESPDIDAVLICSTTDTHSDFIQAAARAGKHIFCEKPIDLEPGKTKRAIAVVKECAVKLQVGFNRRFDPQFSRVREGIKAGEIGKLHFLRISSRDPAPPSLEYVKSSGGLFRDMTIHDFDMARFISGSEVDELYARGAVLVDQEIGKAGDIDTALVSLRFKNGALGIIDNSRKAVYGYDQRIEVFGSRGMLEAKNVESNSVILSNSKKIQQDLPPFFFIERYTESYLRQFRAFVKCLAEDADPPLTGEDGWKSLIIALAAMKSLSENRPVKLSEMGSEPT